MAANASSFYTINPQTKFYSVNLDNIKNKKDAKQVVAQINKDANIEILKSAALYAIGAVATAFIAAVAAIAFKISAFAIGVFTFPLAIIPPIYALTTTIGGLAVGALVGYLIYRQYAAQFIEQGRTHWNHSQHLFQQKEAVLAKQATL